MKEELTYWITLAFIQGITVKRKNEIYVSCYTSIPRISIKQLFDDSSIWNSLGLTDEEKSIFNNYRNQLANNSFLAESLISQGYDIIPMDSPEYPKELKSNLKTSTPTVIFTKGNKQLLQEPSVAIVGSRNADKISLQFTSNLAQKCAAENKVVVSGFAKGVDRMALDACLEANGKSIIILPQGIATFGSGFKQYYRHIIQGRLLVMSAFFPNAPWSVEFAMRRNPYIYGMAKGIYVAQSDDKGGTWAGVIEGLRKKRPIFVRKPKEEEKNANLLLIQKGARPVDMCGNICHLEVHELQTQEERENLQIQEKIKKYLSSGEMTSRMLNERLQLNWSDSKMKSYLRGLPFIEEFKQSRYIYFRLKDNVKGPKQLVLEI